MKGGELMSIASEISRISSNITAAFLAIRNKGGTVGSTPTSDDLATAIASIPTGGTSTPYYIDVDFTSFQPSSIGIDAMDGYLSVPSGTFEAACAAYQAGRRVVIRTYNNNDLIGTTAACELYEDPDDIGSNALIFDTIYVEDIGLQMYDKAIISTMLLYGSSLLVKLDYQSVPALAASSPAPATASDIASGKAAFVDFGLVVGTGSGGGSATPYEFSVDLSDFTTKTVTGNRFSFQATSQAVAASVYTAAVAAFNNHARVTLKLYDGQTLLFTADACELHYEPLISDYDYLKFDSAKLETAVSGRLTEFADFVCLYNGGGVGVGGNMQEMGVIYTSVDSNEHPVTVEIRGQTVIFPYQFYTTSTTTEFAYMTDITFPSGITKIGQYAFYGCGALALTSLPSGVTDIGQYAFYGCNLLALTSLPSGLTQIANSAFYNCSHLALSALPSGVTSIGNYSFYGCTALALTSLPSGLTTVGTQAFRDCSNLAISEIPSTVTTLSTQAFYNCRGLTSITFKGKPNSISTSSFNSCTNITDIYVPWSQGDVANAPWGATNATIHYDYTA